MALSYGYVETIGFIGALEAADAMLKAAKVELVQRTEIGSGLVTVVIEGQLGAVQSAVDAGCVAAERVGQLVSSNVIPRPYTDADFFSVSHNKTKKSSVTEKAKTPAAPLPVSVPKKQSSETKTKIKTIKSVSDSQDIIVSILQKVRKEGASLKEISKILEMDQAATRVILKELLDKEIIEKIQQKYYLI